MYNSLGAVSCRLHAAYSRFHCSADTNMDEAIFPTISLSFWNPVYMVYSYVLFIARGAHEYVQDFDRR